jgi:hypothetical protein
MLSYDGGGVIGRRSLTSEVAIESCEGITDPRPLLAEVRQLLPRVLPGTAS